MKYRKKPVVIDAFDFSKKKKDDDGNNLFDEFDGENYFINTLEGKMRMDDNCFVVIGVKGEKYCVRRDIFFSTYTYESE